MHRRLLSRLTAAALVAGGLVAAGPGLTAPATAGTTVIPVPTSGAGLGRIVTSPDGSIWFAEEKAHQVGKISPGGQITEFPIPAESPGISTVEDLAVAADGSVWVLYDSGSSIRHLDANGNTLLDGQLDSTGRPYGEQVRIAPDGTVWVTMSYDVDYIIRIVGTQIYESPNAPGCDDALAIGRDGTPWCRQDDGLVKVALDGASGVRYPAGNYAAYPYAIAPGPVGSIWFGRYYGGSWFTTPNDGEVGFLDAGTSAITAYNTGEDTAPSDLVQGPDGNMWFTSIGHAKGIGHVSPQGQGALTKIGGYEPAHLTFAQDGSIYATDATNNVIIRVTTDQLQVTNVDPGAGSIFTQQGAAPVVPGQVLPGKVVVPRKPVAARKGRVPLTVACPPGAAACQGTVGLRDLTKRHRPVAKTATYQLQPGKRTTLRLKLTKAGKKALRKHKVTKLRAELTLKGTKPVRVVIKVRR